MRTAFGDRGILLKRHGLRRDDRFGAVLPTLLSTWPGATPEGSAHPTISSHVVKEGVETRQAADIQVHDVFTIPFHHSSIVRPKTSIHGEESSMSTKAMDPVEAVPPTPSHTEIKSSAPRLDQENPELQRRSFGSFLSGVLHVASFIPGPIGMAARVGSTIQRGVQAIRGH
ncbi:hypothetical protein FS842_004367 [Serendipita sp. 407]|nr:hypothetical protein FRC15_003599 [Serendipita sp. 397]KAG9030549.1 hypothetical protein FS842_004367 [Serendipita sp. 407]